MSCRSSPSGVVSTERTVTPVARRVVEGAVTRSAYARHAGREMRAGWLFPARIATEMHHATLQPKLVW